jgi:Ser/Thr protein kinase RdoA (MazF antagonist)
LSARRGGRAPALDDLDVLEWIGRFIGRIHAVGSVEPFRHRPTLDIASFGEEPRAYLLANDWIPAELVDAYASVSAHAIDAVRRCFERAGRVQLLRLHGDCHAGNILWTDSGPHFVDFDDTRMGPAMQDLWMLLSGDRSEMSEQLSRVLSGYEDFRTLDLRELHLVEALRTLRLIHYSAWIARRWDDPAFPAAFTWFNTQRYWQDRVLELREQIAAMEEGPIWAL